MANSLVPKLLCLVIVCLALGSPKAKAAVTCNQVINSLTPCVSYITNGGKVPPAECCSGIKTLYSQAQTKAARQAVCNCIKNTINGLGVPVTNYVKIANGLPKKCGVNLPYQISPNIDCSSVQ